MLFCWQQQAVPRIFVQPFAPKTAIAVMKQMMRMMRIHDLQNDGSLPYTC
jgi:hypothetical protein